MITILYKRENFTLKKKNQAALKKLDSLEDTKPFL